MATPDDRPDDTPLPAPEHRPAVASAWTSTPPQRALVVVVPRTASFQSTIREWMSSLIWRAPA
jgi:hypothetical protein